MTTVRLFKDIGLSMSFKKSIDFAGSSVAQIKQNQTSWFNSRIDTTVTDVAFNKLQNLLHLPMDYGDALEFTYVRFDDLDDSGRYYYYFIANVTLVDDSTVAFQLVLDPLQTFMGEWSLGECMVNMGHVDRWGSGNYPINTAPPKDGANSLYHVEHSEILNDVYSGNNMELSLSHFVILYFDNESVMHCGIVPIPNQELWKTNTVGYSCRTPDGNSYLSVLDIIDNSFLSHYSIVPENVIVMAVLPISPFTTNVTVEAGDIVGQTVVTVAYSIPWHWSLFNQGLSFVAADNPVNFGHMADLKFDDFLEPEMLFWPKEKEVSVTRPVKPTNGAMKSMDYEPYLFMAPYMYRRILSPLSGGIIDITDNVLFDDYSMYASGIITPSAQGTEFMFTNETIHVNNVDVNEIFDIKAKASAEGLIDVLQAMTFDVFSNAWLTYLLTKRDTDRQIINNNNWQNAIQNLLFMGYGGALVGSRGGGLVKNDIPILDNNRSGPPNVLGFRRGLNPALGGAVGLAAGASIISSLVDAHFAWENQKLKEQQIKNEPKKTLITGSSGFYGIFGGGNSITYTELVIDDTSRQIAFDKFFKYGYELNYYSKPNIRSRKFFNYLLTNGAIVEGAITQAVKDDIAAIFDSGITIFHMDYASSTNYEDITQENIERSLM